MVKAPGSPKGRQAAPSVAAASSPSVIGGAGGTASSVKLAIRKGKVGVGYMKSADRVATETLDTIQNEALNEIVEKCLARPDKILILARIVDNESYFRKKVGISKDWLHKTIVKFSAVPKSEIIEACLEFSRQSASVSWKEADLRRLDRRYNLRGVERLFGAMTGIRMSDNLPAKCHYRPLLRKCLVTRFQKSMFKDAVMIGQAGDLQGVDAYAFEEESDGFYTKIKCIEKGCSIEIPEDYAVKVGGTWQIVCNWSMHEARMKGKTVDKNILELFVDAGEKDKFDHDPKRVLENEVEDCFAEFKDEFDSTLQTMQAEDLPDGLQPGEAEDDDASSGP